MNPAVPSSSTAPLQSATAEHSPALPARKGGQSSHPCPPVGHGGTPPTADHALDALVELLARSAAEDHYNSQLNHQSL